MLSKGESKPSENNNGKSDNILQIKNLSKDYYTNGGPIVDAITKEIIHEFREFELEGLRTVEEYHNNNNDNENGDLVAAAPSPVNISIL